MHSAEFDRLKARKELEQRSEPEISEILLGSPLNIPNSVLYIGGLLIYIVQLFLTLTHQPTWFNIIYQCFLALNISALILLRNVLTYRAILVWYVVAAFMACGFDLLFRTLTASWILFAVASLLLYRLPLRKALPWWLAMLLLLLVQPIEVSVLNHVPIPLIQEVIFLLAYPGLGYLALSRRARQLLIVRLKNTQQRLLAEMEQTAKMAAIRERTRIARDIHDVLAHSLTVLSIQIQATRVLAQQQPEQVPEKLEQMAALLRESQAESRRIVGLLRVSDSSNETELEAKSSTRLQEISMRYEVQTGVRCVFTTVGDEQALSTVVQEALQYALQEAMTNASRHGAAQHIWIKLLWQEQMVLLTIRDDGHEPKEGYVSPGTHNGLRGMRERIEALGGTLESGPYPGGGFAVTLLVPLKQKEEEERQV